MRSGVGAVFIIPGGLLYIASWIVSIAVGFSEGGAWGFAFLFFGFTGPIAGLIEGLAWGNWTALVLAGIAMVSIGIGVAISGDN